METASEVPTKEELQRARDLYACDDVAIDDNALASRTDNGVWIQAWVWLGKEEEKSGTP